MNDGSEKIEEIYSPIIKSDSNDAVNELLNNKLLVGGYYQSTDQYSRDEPPKEYESIIQKLEGEVRNHIRVTLTVFIKYRSSNK